MCDQRSARLRKFTGLRGVPWAAMLSKHSGVGDQAVMGYTPPLRGKTCAGNPGGTMSTYTGVCVPGRAEVTSRAMGPPTPNPPHPGGVSPPLPRGLITASPSPPISGSSRPGGWAGRWIKSRQLLCLPEAARWGVGGAQAARGWGGGGALPARPRGGGRLLLGFQGGGPWAGREGAEKGEARPPAPRRPPPAPVMWSGRHTPAL
jgi:hypothetical protein